MTSQSSNPALEALRQQWEAAAGGWDAHSPMLRAWLAGPTRTLFDAAGVAEGQSALDVAAGAGDQTLMLAERVGTKGHILATDLSPSLIESLKRHAQDAGLATVEARVADAQDPLDEADAFDAAVCRLGLMLMPEPSRCLSSVHTTLKPGGRFAALVFAEPDANPCIRILMSTALRHAGLPPRDPFASGGLFSLGRPGHLDRLFEEAGFREVSTFRIDAPFRLPSVDGYMVFLRSAAAPVIAVLSKLESEAREAAWRDIREQLLSEFARPDGWIGPNTLLVTAGRK
jgi:SAM-dependent methyltransferase